MSHSIMFTRCANQGPLSMTDYITHPLKQTKTEKNKKKLQAVCGAVAQRATHGQSTRNI